MRGLFAEGSKYFQGFVNGRCFAGRAQIAQHRPQPEAQGLIRGVGGDGFFQAGFFGMLNSQLGI